MAKQKKSVPVAPDLVPVAKEEELPAPNPAPAFSEALAVVSPSLVTGDQSSVTAYPCASTESDCSVQESEEPVMAVQLSLLQKIANQLVVVAEGATVVDLRNLIQREFPRDWDANGQRLVAQLERMKNAVEASVQLSKDLYAQVFRR
jgi:hypothetical protein